MTNDDLFRKFIGKKVFIKLKSNRNYSGVVSEVNDVGNGLIFIVIIDKFNKFVMFTSGEIEVVEEYRE